MKRIAIIDGEQREVVIERHGDTFEIVIDGRKIVADLQRANASLDSLLVGDGRQYAIAHHQNRDRHEVDFQNFRIDIDLVDPLTLASRGGADDIGSDEQTIRAVMPGRVVRVDVSVGDSVERGKSLLVVEAMKMENAVEAPRDGTVVTVHVEVGSTVESGAELVTIE